MNRWNVALPGRWHGASPVYYGMPAPYLLQQEIFIELIPNGSNVFVDSGLWSIRLYPVRIVDGRFSMWMSDARTRNIQTRFLRPTPDATLTIPSAASRTIAVGAYDARTNSYASFSGRGWPDEPYPVHPGSRSTWRRCDSAGGTRWIPCSYRYFLCDALCRRLCSAFDAVGYRQWK